MWDSGSCRSQSLQLLELRVFSIVGLSTLAGDGTSLWLGTLSIDRVPSHRGDLNTCANKQCYRYFAHLAGSFAVNCVILVTHRGRLG